MRKLVWARWLVVGLLAISMSGCAGGDDSADSGASGDGSDEAITAAAPGGGADPPSANVGQLPPVPIDVIKSAEVDLEVPEDGLTGAVRETVQVAARFDGYALSSSVDTENETGTVVIRVPAFAFERALAAVEDLATVTRHDVGGDEVGQQFLDLEARIRNQRSQEAALLALMEQAASVDETLRIQDELGVVRLEIEKMQGRLRYLRDQTSLATIGANFSVGTAPQGKDPGVLAEAWATAREVGIRSLGGFIVLMGFMLPISIVSLIAWLVGRAIKVRRAVLP